MRLRQLIIKEIKQSLRDKQGLVMMILFPLILTVVLGFALSGMFSGNSTPVQVQGLYCLDDQSQFSQTFVKFLPGVEKNLALTEEKDKDKAKKLVQTAEAICFIEVADKKITVYAREGRTFEASLANTIMKGFAGTYDAYFAVLSVDPGAKPLLDQAEHSQTAYTNEVSLNSQPKPRAMDYYALTMLTLIVMYGAMYGTSAVADERRNKTLYRMFATPAKSMEILVSKVIGNILAISAQIGFVFLIDKIFLNTYWGDNLLPIFVILLAQIIMVVSFGVAIGYMFKSSDAGTALIQTIIPVLAFLGGAYVNLEVLGVTGFIEKLTRISPIRWINRTILQIVYAKDFSDFTATIAICLAIALVFLGFSAVISRKELKV